MPTEDITTKVAKIEVKIENLEKITDALSSEMEAVSKEMIINGKDLVGIIKQFKGITSQFSAFSVKLQDLEDDARDLESLIKTQANNFETFKENLGLFSFIKKHKEKTIEVILLFIAFIMVVGAIANPEVFISKLLKVGKAVLGF